MWVQYAVWWAEVVGWWLPLIAAASVGWTLLKNVKAVLVLGLVAAVLTYLVFGFPGSSTGAFAPAPAPQQPVAAAPVPRMSEADALALRRSLYAPRPPPTPPAPGTVYIMHTETHVLERIDPAEEPCVAPSPNPWEHKTFTCDTEGRLHTMMGR